MNLPLRLVYSILLPAWLAAGMAAAQTTVVPAPQPESGLHLTSTAQLLAGIAPPPGAPYAGLAQREAWKKHSAGLQSAWTRVRDGQMAAMTKWRDANLPKDCPVGNTLLYPFSGPDFFNAYRLFPACENFVMFGLEHIGELPEIEAMGEREFAQLLTDVRSAMVNLFERNYFVTSTMAKQLRTERLRGVVPVLAVSMALSGLEVLRIEPLVLRKSTAEAVPQSDPQIKRRSQRRLTGVAIEFRKPGAKGVQRLHYFSLDATDTGIAEHPEFLDHLRSLAPATMLLKSASYLLHGVEFRKLRSVLLDTATFLVQDDTGLPYPMLVKRGWQVELYGRYEMPIPPFEYAYQPSLAKMYEARKPETLPFLFGYRRNIDGDRAHLMVARLASSTSQLTPPGKRQ
ncbi:MAG: hypothetical protein KIT18_08710 [Burkholderiales bacterium]|nr:hypothetical protein [Burkholderiales bacterium]